MLVSYILYITVGLNNWLTVDTKGYHGDWMKIRFKPPPRPPPVQSLFVLVDTVCPSQYFFSHVGMFSWVESVLSNKDEVSCSGTQHFILDEIRCHNLAI